MHCKLNELKTVLDTPTAKLQAQEEGGITIGHMQCDSGTDLSPLLKGLKDDACQCRHWGYVLKGEIIVEYSDSSVEKISAGESYYLPPGHSIKFEKDTQYIEFSPTEELKEVFAHIEKVMAEAS